MQAPDAAVAELVRVHHRRLLGLASLLVDDAGAAEAVVAAALLDVAGHDPEPADVDRLDDAVVDAARLRTAPASRWRRRRTTPASPRPEPPPHGPGAPPAAGATEHPETEELPDPVWLAVAELPARQRLVLVLTEYLDRSPLEIADHLETSGAAVAAELSRALAALGPIADSPDPERVEHVVADALRRRAEDVMAAADSERALADIWADLSGQPSGRPLRGRGRRRLLALASAGAVTVVGLAWWAGPGAGDDDPPVDPRPPDRTVSVAVDEVPPTPVEPAYRFLSQRDTASFRFERAVQLAAVDMAGDAGYFVSRDPDTHELVLSRRDLAGLARAGSARPSALGVELVRFAGARVLGAWLGERVLVLAVDDGAPADRAADFFERSDGYLLVDVVTRRTLAWTPTQIAGRPDQPVAEGGGTDLVWGPLEYPRLAALRLTDGAIAGSVPVPNLVSGAWASGPLLWATSLDLPPTTVVGVVPPSGRVAVTVPDIRHQLGSLAADENGLLLTWTELGRSVLVRVRIDGSADAVSVSAPSGGDGGDVVVSDSGFALWVLEDGRVLSVDTARLEVVDAWVGPEPGRATVAAAPRSGVLLISEDGMRGRLVPRA